MQSPTEAELNDATFYLTPPDLVTSLAATKIILDIFVEATVLFAGFLRETEGNLL